MLVALIMRSFNKHSYPISDNGKYDSINGILPNEIYDVILEFNNN